MTADDEAYARAALAGTRVELHAERLRSREFQSIELVGEPPDAVIRVEWTTRGRPETRRVVDYEIFDPGWYGTWRHPDLAATLIAVDVEETPSPI
jgi:hypothetical protein